MINAFACRLSYICMFGMPVIFHGFGELERERERVDSG